MQLCKRVRLDEKGFRQETGARYCLTAVGKASVDRATPAPHTPPPFISFSLRLSCVSGNFRISVCISVCVYARLFMYWCMCVCVCVCVCVFVTHTCAKEEGLHRVVPSVAQPLCSVIKSLKFVVLNVFSSSLILYNSPPASSYTNIFS